MKSSNITDILEPILKRDLRYSESAYYFVRDALNHTVKKLDKPRHVSGQELLEGIRKYALSEYGPITKRVLAEWGITECLDFGNIVFNLVDEGLLGKTSEDSIEDFIDGYDFSKAFDAPYKPKKQVVS